MCVFVCALHVRPACALTCAFLRTLLCPFPCALPPAPRRCPLPPPALTALPGAERPPGVAAAAVAAGRAGGAAMAVFVTRRIPAEGLRVLSQAGG